MVTLKYSEYALREIREALALKQKITPFFKTLDFTDEAEDLFNLQDDYKPASINIVENPGLNNGDAGWSADARVVLASTDSDAEDVRGGNNVVSPASIILADYTTSAALSSMDGSFLGFGGEPDVPTDNGIYTYYDTGFGTWHYIVVPFQTSWQDGDSSNTSGRTWINEFSRSAVANHLDGGTYDSSLRYAFYDGTPYEVATFTESVDATDGDITTGNFGSAVIRARSKLAHI